jgi:hypothetical protein
MSEQLSDAVPEGSFPPSARLDDLEWRLGTITDQAGKFEENLLAAALSVLSHVQDEVVRELREGWPVVDADGTTRERGALLPLPEASVEDGMLMLRYERSGKVALRLPPIRVRESPLGL